MNLLDCELLPGTVVDTGDSTFQGKVRLEVPTVYQAGDKSQLPWVGPMTQSSSNHYRSPKDGDKVWLIYNKSDPGQSFYLPFFELDSDTRQLARTENDVEVVMNRTTSTGSRAQIYHGDQSGTVVSSSDARLNITQDGDIVVENSGSLELTLKEGKITAGNKTQDYEPAVLGQQLKDLLTTLKNDLVVLMSACERESFTVHLGDPLGSIITNLENGITRILSSNIEIN